VLGFATTLVIAFELLRAGSELRPTVVFALVFIGFSGFGISAIRAAPRAVFDLMSHFKAHRELDDPNCRAILVYGAGMRGMMYLKNLSLTQAALSHQQTYLAAQVIGFIDDDRNLRHRVVFGQRVLGEGSELQSLAIKNRIDTVVIAASLSLDKSSELIRICDSMKIKLVEWQLNEVALNSVAYAHNPATKNPTSKNQRAAN
jgi:FlaA1/EpsC-like NDP-sugar epimerase